MQGVFHFGRVDILRTRNDHVLHPVVDVQIAIFIQIAGVPGQVPAVHNGLGGGFCLAMITAHHAHRLDADFAHLPRRQFLAVAIDDLHLVAGEGLAATAHAGVAGGIMIIRRQIDHRAAGFGGAIALDEAGIGEGRHRPAQHIERDRRGAIIELGHGGEIGRHGFQILADGQQHRRHRKHAGDAFVGNGAHHARHIRPRQDHHGGAGFQRVQRPAAAADVEQGHGHQRHVVLIPAAPILPRQSPLLDGAEQLAVAEQRALGKTGGAAGVKLQRDITRADGGHGIIGLMAGNPLGKGRPARERGIKQDHGLQPRDAARLLHQRQEAGFRNDDANAGITQDIGDFARHQPGVDRHQHRPEPEAGAHQCDIIGVVQRQPANPVTLVHASTAQRRNRLQHTAMQIAMAPHRAINPYRRLVRCAGGVMRGHFGKCRELRGHANPPCPACAAGSRFLPLSIAGSVPGL